jgi:N-terminal acetyltransferase B complex non-catalytic subunit
MAAGESQVQIQFKYLLMSISGSKLGTLYDHLDGGNYRAGLKLSNSLLEKHPTSGIVKCLKAFALERSGRTDEAHQVCE